MRIDIQPSIPTEGQLNRRVVLSGCSGGGKSTLLRELRRRGYPIVEEPGRRIVVEQMRINGAALPWVDMVAFLHRVSTLARDDLRSANMSKQWLFLDRGLVDAASALQHFTGVPVLDALADEVQHYHPLVFLVPPWPEIYARDQERRHGLTEATAEYLRLLDSYAALKYRICLVPKATVSERADFVLETLG
ncbi:AAA family ATPase [Cupriavidus plantarum]|uniref:AAA family ATPase n=1 Tax=Cupriavidus plantarum TaxID=942865 RepID=UPI00339D4817